jgi:hypothetical protein
MASAALRILQVYCDPDTPKSSVPDVTRVVTKIGIVRSDAAHFDLDQDALHCSVVRYLALIRGALHWTRVEQCLTKIYDAEVHAAQSSAALQQLAQVHQCLADAILISAARPSAQDPLLQAALGFLEQHRRESEAMSPAS